MGCGGNFRGIVLGDGPANSGQRFGRVGEQNCNQRMHQFLVAAGRAVQMLDGGARDSTGNSARNSGGCAGCRRLAGARASASRSNFRFRCGSGQDRRFLDARGCGFDDFVELLHVHRLGQQRIHARGAKSGFVFFGHVAGKTDDDLMA